MKPIIPPETEQLTEQETKGRMQNRSSEGEFFERTHKTHHKLTELVGDTYVCRSDNGVVGFKRGVIVCRIIGTWSHPRIRIKHGKTKLDLSKRYTNIKFRICHPSG